MPGVTPTPALPRWLTYVPLEQVIPAARNPRTHDAKAIRRAIVEFGFTAPLRVDERTQRLIAGHGRLAALVALYEEGAAMPGGIVADDDGSWLVPLIRGWASRTDAEAEAQIIADNRLTENGGWHHQTLGAMLENLNAAAAPLLDLTGFDGAAMDDLLRTVNVEGLGNDPLLGGADATRRADSPAPAGRDGDSPIPGEPAGAPRSDLGRSVCCPGCGLNFPAAV